MSDARTDTVHPGEISHWRESDEELPCAPRALPDTGTGAPTPAGAASAARGSSRSLGAADADCHSVRGTMDTDAVSASAHGAPSAALRGDAGPQQRHAAAAVGGIPEQPPPVAPVVPPRRDYTASARAANALLLNSCAARAPQTLPHMIFAQPGNTAAFEAETRCRVEQAMLARAHRACYASGHDGGAALSGARGEARYTWISSLVGVICICKGQCAHACRDGAVALDARWTRAARNNIGTVAAVVVCLVFMLVILLVLCVRVAYAN